MQRHGVLFYRTLLRVWFGFYRFLKGSHKWTNPIIALLYNDIILPVPVYDLYDVILNLTSPCCSLHYLPPHCQPQTTCYNRPAPGYAPPPGPSPIYQHQQTTLQPLRHEANISQQDFMASPHGLATSQLSVQRAHAASSVSPYGYGEMNYSSAPLGGVFNHNSSAYNSYPQQFHTFDM